MYVNFNVHSSDVKQVIAPLKVDGRSDRRARRLTRII